MEIIGTACAYNFSMIEMYEEKRRGNRRLWGFTHLLTDCIYMHVSRSLCAQISTPEYTQTFIHAAPGVYSSRGFVHAPIHAVPYTPLGWS